MDQPPGGNLNAILANWFTPLEMRLLHTDEIASGLSEARLWRIIIGKRSFCLRRTPIVIVYTNQVADLRQVHAFLEYLWAAGIRDLAFPIRTLKDQTLVETFDAIWELANFLPGESVQNPTLSQAVAAVEFLARLHVASASYQSFPLRMAPGLKQRRELCQELRSGKLEEIDAAIEHSVPSSKRDLAQSIASQVRSVLPKVIDHLESARDKVPVQWCLVDCHVGNFLFTGDEVTGLVDFATADLGSVARDVARFVGSVGIHESNRWQACLDAYQRRRQLSAAELQLVLAFHTSGLLGTASRWLDWQFISRLDVGDAATTHARLEQLSAQLAAIDETAAIFADF